MLESIHKLRKFNQWTLIVYLNLQQHFAESIFDVSRETLNDATFWTKYVTSRNYFPVDGKLVTIT